MFNHLFKATSGKKVCLGRLLNESFPPYVAGSRNLLSWTLKCSLKCFASSRDPKNLQRKIIPINFNLLQRRVEFKAIIVFVRRQNVVED